MKKDNRYVYICITCLTVHTLCHISLSLGVPAALRHRLSFVTSFTGEGGAHTSMGGAKKLKLTPGHEFSPIPWKVGFTHVAPAFLFPGECGG